MADRIIVPNSSLLPLLESSHLCSFQFNSSFEKSVIPHRIDAGFGPVTLFSRQSIREATE